MVATLSEIECAKTELQVLRFIASKTASHEAIVTTLKRPTNGPGSAKHAVKELRRRREISQRRRNVRVSSYTLTRKGLCRLVESLNENTKPDRRLFQQITVTYPTMLSDIFQLWREITKRGIEDIMISTVQHFCGSYYFVAENHGTSTADRWMLPTLRDVIPAGLLIRFVNDTGRRRHRIARVLRESAILRREVTRVLLGRFAKTTIVAIREMTTELQLFPKHKIKLMPDSNQINSAHELKTVLESLDSALDTLIYHPTE